MIIPSLFVQSHCAQICPAALNFGHLLRRIHIRKHGIAGGQQTSQCRSSCPTAQQQAPEAANQRIAEGSKSPQDRENAHLAVKSHSTCWILGEYASMHVGKYSLSLYNTI